MRREWAAVLVLVFLAGVCGGSSGPSKEAKAYAGAMASGILATQKKTDDVKLTNTQATCLATQLVTVKGVTEQLQREKLTPAQLRADVVKHDGDPTKKLPPSAVNFMADAFQKCKLGILFATSIAKGMQADDPDGEACLAKKMDDEASFKPFLLAAFQGKKLSYATTRPIAKIIDQCLDASGVVVQEIGKKEWVRPEVRGCLINRMRNSGIMTTVLARYMADQEPTAAETNTLKAQMTACRKEASG